MENQTDEPLGFPDLFEDLLAYEGKAHRLAQSIQAVRIRMQNTDGTGKAEIALAEAAYRSASNVGIILNHLRHIILNKEA